MIDKSVKTIQAGHFLSNCICPSVEYGNGVASNSEWEDAIQKCYAEGIVVVSSSETAGRYAGVDFTGKRRKMGLQQTGERRERFGFCPPGEVNQAWLPKQRRFKAPDSHRSVPERFGCQTIQYGNADAVGDHGANWR